MNKTDKAGEAYMNAQHEKFAYQAPVTDSHTVARYCEVKLDNGKRIKLRDYKSNSSYLVGIEVNNEGDEIVPKGKATERQHVIVVNCIKSIIPLRINLTYGTLEPIPQIEGDTFLGRDEHGNTKA